MNLEVIQKTSTHGSLSKEAPVVYYGRVEPIDLSVISKVVPQYELDFANRYSGSADANAFLSGRFFLRSILGSYLNIDPASIDFIFTKTGKPYLRESAINFNLSHTENVLAVAFVLGEQIGVDVENTDRDMDVIKMLPIFFSTAEQRLIESTEPIRRKQLFIDIWTKKEALLKACGSGLSFPTKELDMTSNGLFDLDSRMITKIKDTYWAVESRNIFGNYRLSVAIKNNSPHKESVILSYMNLQECTL